MGAPAELLSLISQNVAEQFAIKRAKLEEDFRTTIEGWQQSIEGGKVVARATELLVPVLEEVADVNPRIKSAKDRSVHIIPDIRPMPLLDPKSGVLVRSFLFLRWGDKLGRLSDEEETKIQTANIQPESPWSAFWRSLRRIPTPQPLDVVEYDFYQVLTTIDPDDVMIEVCTPGVIADARLLNTQQVIKDPKSILTPLWDSLQYPRHERKIRQVPTTNAAV